MKVLEKIDIDKRYFLIKTDFKEKVLPGQFFMLRSWENYPTLSRPISIFDFSQGADFLIEELGEGTSLLRTVKKGDSIKLYGPYGNSFNTDVDEVALVGGGVGIAPMYYLAKKIKGKNPQAKVSLYIGLNGETQIDKLFLNLKNLGVDVKVKFGGYITDIIEFEKHKLVYACGPDPMMEKVALICKDKNIESYVSLDKRMACGVGACLGCTVKTKNGNKRCCKDGPIFLGSDVYE